AGIIAAVVMTRGGPTPEPVSPAPQVQAPPQQKSRAAQADPQREREKRRPDYLRCMGEGGIAAKSERFEDAARAYGEALKLFPDDPDAQRGLTEVRAALVTRSKDKKDKPEVDQRQVGFTRFLEQGKEAMAAKQYAAAVRAFQQAVQLLP